MHPSHEFSLAGILRPEVQTRIAGPPVSYRGIPVSWVTMEPSSAPISLPFLHHGLRVTHHPSSFTSSRARKEPETCKICNKSRQNRPKTQLECVKYQYPLHSPCLSREHPIIMTICAQISWNGCDGHFCCPYLARQADHCRHPPYSPKPCSPGLLPTVTFKFLIRTAGDGQLLILMSEVRVGHECG